MAFGGSRWGKSMWFLNYGKYNLTYVLIAVNGVLCGASHQMNADSNTSAQFGSGMDSALQQTVLAAIDNAIIEQGSNIMHNAAMIQQVLPTLNGAWTILIADPSARYGYWNCMYPNYWFGLKAYKNFKWNYFGSQRLS